MPDDDGSVTITLSSFEARNLSVFLAAWLPGTPEHLRGSLPDVKRYLDEEIVQANIRAGGADAGMDREGRGTDAGGSD